MPNTLLQTFGSYVIIVSIFSMMKASIKLDFLPPR